MYLTITPQKLSKSFRQSAADFVSYLEKENEGKVQQEKELFFNHTHDNIEGATVVQEIDGNVAKLKKIEPKYYSITINPSRRELEHLKNHPESLKLFTREVMKEYAGAFNRELNGKSISVEDIKYYAKIEYERSFKGTDREIKENAPFVKRIAHLENELKKVERGEIPGNLQSLKQELRRLHEQIPHKINNKIVRQGMLKDGLQTHVHIIVSRKDASNSISLSPGSKYRSSEVMMHGKLVKRGFDRDDFFKSAEKTFDRMFNYNRNYVESYSARKAFVKDPKKYYAQLALLSPAEKRIAFMIMGKAGINIPHLNISQSQVSFALKQIKKALGVGIRSSSIGY